MSNDILSHSAIQRFELDDLLYEPIDWDEDMTKSKWEYRTIATPEYGPVPDEELNHLGAEGWQFAGAYNGFLVFRRIIDYYDSHNPQKIR